MKRFSRSIRYGLIYLALLSLVGLVAAAAMLRYDWKNFDFQVREFQLLSDAIVKAPNGNEQEALAPLGGYRENLRRNHIQIWILDGEGRVIARLSEEPLPYTWEELPHPTKLWEPKSGGPLLGDWLVNVTLLREQPVRYVVFGKWQKQRYWASLRVVRNLGVYAVLVALISAIISAVFIVSYLKKKSSEAQRVLSRLEKGDLSARFIVGQFDEFTELMLGFNRMADKLSDSLLKVERVERARSQLLQGLSHDLRTPLTSLKAMIETLSFHETRLTDEQRRMSLEVAMQEVDYLTKLIEDLFLLANMDELQPRQKAESVNLRDLLELEIERLQAVVQKQDRALSCRFEPENAGPWVVYGDRSLLKRMIRNILENAARYAESSVHVAIKSNSGHLAIVIRDNGPGFSPENLGRFGVRPPSRKIEKRADGHISAGLGSVIMTSIAKSHQGGVKAENWISPDGKIAGAQVTIRLPTNLG